MWVCDVDDKKLYAYNLADYSRQADKDLLLDTGNTEPRSIWSDGTTMWVVDGLDNKLYAYNLTTTARDAIKDINFPIRPRAELHSERGERDTVYIPEENPRPKNTYYSSRRSIQFEQTGACLLYTSPSPRDRTRSRMPSSA